MHKPVVYLAGPISQVSHDEASTWRAVVAGELDKLGIDSLDPLRGKHRFLAHKPAGDVEYTARNHGITPQQIVIRDKADIRKSDLVLVNFLDVAKRGLMVFGSTMEISYAADQGKPVIIVTNDCASPWLTYHSIRIVPTLEEAIAVIHQYFGGY